MSLPISRAGIGGVFVLAACAPQAPAPPGEAVECALGAGAGFAAVCTIEREAAPGRFVLHHPDGGFRRLLFDQAAGAIFPADGAERVSAQTTEGEALMVRIGSDAYRIPRSLLADTP